jgi:hypothetical protein
MYIFRGIMDRRKFIITTAGIAGGIGVYTYSTTPRLSVASPKPVETPSIPKPLNTNEYFDIPINPFEIQGENLSSSSDITIVYEIRRASDDSSVSTATESITVPTSGSFTVNTQGRKLRLRNSDISGGSEDFYIHITISHPDTGTLDAQSAGFTVKESGSYFNVSITGSSSPVDVENTLTVDYEVENTGTESDTQTITLDVAGDQRDSNSEMIGSGNTVTGSLSWATESGDAGDYTAEVSSDDETATTSLSVIIAGGDGSKLFLVDNSDDEIQQYSLDSPYNLGSATLDHTYPNIFETTTPISNFAGALQFSKDGKKLFTGQYDGSNFRLEQFNLSTAHDISTMPSSPNKTYYWNSNNSDADNASTGLVFKEDGTKFFRTTRTGTGEIREYEMSNPWDVTSISYVQMYSSGPADYGAAVNTDGTKFYAHDFNSADIYQWKLNTAWSLNNIVLEKSANSAGSGSPVNVVFNKDGTKYYTGNIEVGETGLDVGTLGTPFEVDTLQSTSTFFSSQDFSGVDFDTQPHY